jgi:hypothetical protein
MTFPGIISAAFFLFCLTACHDPQESGKAEATSIDTKDPDQIVRTLIKSEETVQRITPLLKEIAKKISTGSSLPLDLPKEWASKTKHHEWLAASFGVLEGNFKGESFVTKTKFEGSLIDRKGSRLGLMSKQKLVWESGGDDQWNLKEWIPLELKLIKAPRALFKDVTETVIPSSFARDIAQRSEHAEITEQALAEKKLIMPKREYADLPDMESAYQYPSVSVVDYNGDGHDDIFVSARYTPSQLFRNNGDGTFEDVSIEAGLPAGNCVNFALFADFDNDGDPDALFCRSLEPTLYYQNNKGRFENVTHRLCDLGEQHFVVSASTADVNRDGLLDIYLTTYTPGPDVLPIWKERYLTPDEAKRLEELSKTAHPYFNDRGGANVLLMNRGGGKLERAGGDVVKLWRKSYQPAWADVDGDGDDDLYVCNDFAPDSYLRNDTPPGAKEPVFVEAYDEVFPVDSMAFGMGASFEDYDQDGDLDLFVSNMYSKAGNRIIGLVGGVDPRIRVAARGNFLYRNDGGKFHQVADLDSPVAQTGWSFGGQFADFNNDGQLDLYIPSGYYSAPKRVATEVDL